MVRIGAASVDQLTNNGAGVKNSSTYHQVTEIGAESQSPTKSAGDFWMRSISFAGLHRLLSAVTPYDNGLRPFEINRLIQKGPIILTKRLSAPSPTTLYHYRNTLLRLKALVRVDDRLTVNWSDPDVCELAKQPPSDGPSLDNKSLDLFASLVLRNRECQRALFNLFLPTRTPDVQTFREKGTPVFWCRAPDPNVGVFFNSQKADRFIQYNTESSINAILYGIRYWARDELRLIDEYPENCGRNYVVMFTIRKRSNTSIKEMVHLIISKLDQQDWTSFSILDLIEKCCLQQHYHIDLLHEAIEWLIQRFPGHVVPIRTSRAMATLGSPARRRDLHLKRYFRSAAGGPYTSHIRIHKDISKFQVICHDQ